MTTVDTSTPVAGPVAEFDRFGGTALGLSIARAATGAVPGLWVAPSVVARLDELAGRAVPDAIAGREVILKASGLREAFTRTATRGAHCRFPRLTVPPGASWDRLLAAIAHLLPDGTVALVAQRIIAGDGWPGPVIAHADGFEVRLEFESDGARMLYLWAVHEPPELYRTAGDGGRPPGWCAPVAALHHRLAAVLGFPVNTEGFVGRDGRYGVVQLRPVPGDAPVDLVLTCEIRELSRRGALLRRTPFAWGTFDLTVDGSAVRDGTDPRVTTRRPDAGATGPAAPVFLDLVGGFSLSHAVEHLPPPGPARDALRYLGLPGLALDHLAGRTVRLLSDGRTGAIVTT